MPITKIPRTPSYMFGLVRGPQKNAAGPLGVHVRQVAKHCSRATKSITFCPQLRKILAF